MKARYFHPDVAEQWDEFCAGCYGATFLHTRRFLSYHGDRFADFSILLEDDGKLLGVIPAARHPGQRDVVVSHPGSTYGGILHQGRLRGSAMLNGLELAASLWHSSGFTRLHYKAVPHIYQSAPAQDDLYALFRAGALRYRCDLSSCIDLQHRLAVSDRRRRGGKKARIAGVEVVAGGHHLGALWKVLADNLHRKHGARPVHTFDEITLLAQRFRDCIHVITAIIDGKVEAGIVLFLSNMVAHAQYIASSEKGHKINALDLVFEAAVEQSKLAGKRFFDFGISTEDEGNTLNEGLNRFKNEFGASGVVHEFYEMTLKGSDNAAK
ncbi:GNAT family N-acetyltransferase [Paraburkholderia silvatlantica]|uniref:Acetyltransferase (GNAT) family protein n=1 Tax=Paraburkholderia silvatlantica TaxID=321895 RepID=A0A2V4TG98_9BURK|nr:GNAT family N-acetyltransferase [Paraburkholderia silvatlantica]PYE22841.1 acetyltransferase (GNAT) family protein [Paraburkholderia silvatlantica]TDQ89870.1 acetyltransferase (GNAT) family protein [Paraburkholderia silvatlantica]